MDQNQRLRSPKSLFVDAAQMAERAAAVHEVAELESRRALEDSPAETLHRMPQSHANH